MILITSKHNQKSLSLPFSVNLNRTSINLSSTVRNPDVALDQNLSFQQHVSRTCQICYFELHRINSIHHYLSQDALKTLIYAFVLSRIDYCNSLLAGRPKQIIHKLQKVQIQNTQEIKSTLFNKTEQDKTCKFSMTPVSDTRLLRTPSFRLKSFGQRKFSHQASVLWNSLPISLRHSNPILALKSALKTHFFQSQ